MVIAGKMIWDDIVNPNWIRASPSAVRPNMIPLFQDPGSCIWGPSKTSGAARREAALTIGLLTERSSSTTANAVCDDDRPLADRIWIATTTAERPATTAAVSSAAAKPAA